MTRLQAMMQSTLKNALNEAIRNRRTSTDTSICMVGRGGRYPTCPFHHQL